MTVQKINRGPNDGGFTLIELLIVIAILGALAVVILIGLNPVQQLAKTRDAGRLSTVAQMGHALEAFATTNNGTYVPTANAVPCNIASTSFLNCLVRSGELSLAPALIPNTLSLPICTGGGAWNGVSGWCYNNAGATGNVVYSKLEANANVSRCGTGIFAWAVYSTIDGRGGMVCSATEPVGGAQTFL